jgi:DNA-binding LacI/PurR family transcriptional regulator
MVLGEGTELEGAYVRQFVKLNPRCQLVIGEPQKRPSFVNQFSGVIDVSGTTPDSFLRDLVVRGIPVVVIGREPRTYSLDSVLVDLLFGATRLTRDLIQQGHTAFVTVEQPGRNVMTDTVRQALARQGNSVTVDSVGPADVLVAINNGATALICDSQLTATTVLQRLAEANIPVPSRVSVVAIGVTSEDENQPCTGCYVPIAEVVENAARLLSDTQQRRPTTLWLAPLMVSRNTTAPVHSLYPSNSTDAHHGIAPGESLSV